MEYGDYIVACDFYILPLELKQKFIHALTFLGIGVSESVRRLAHDNSIVTLSSHLVMYRCPHPDQVFIDYEDSPCVTGKLLTIDDINLIIELSCVGYRNE